MAEIFLSYANEDRETAGQIAALLESAGWTVWWDRRIPAGRTWRSVIEDALTEMRCMVVLWSNASVDSHWVKEEAEEARALNKLIPVLIEAVKPPVGFRAIQAADLVDWDGSCEAPGAKQLIVDLQGVLGKPPEKDASKEAAKPAVNEPSAEARREAHHEPPKHQESVSSTANGKGAIPWPAVSAAGAFIAAVLAALWLWPKGETPQGPTPEIVVKAPETPRVVRLGVKNSATQFKSGETRTLHLEAEYSDGSTKEVKESVVWNSSDNNVAQIDNAGQVKALQPGTANITARYGDVASGEWTLTVEVPPALAKVPPSGAIAPKPQLAQAPEPPVKAAETARLTHLAIGNARKELRPGDKLALRVRARYSDGSEKPTLDQIEWRSSDSTVAAVNQRGEVDALRAGRVEIRARADGVTSAPVAIRVAEATKPVEPIVPKIPEMTLKPVEKPDYPNVESLRARLAPYLSRAKSYRAQGNYAGALAELERARSVDPSSAEVRQEIEQTRKACNAEKSLGYNVNCG